MLVALLAIGGGAILTWLFAGTGFANYDVAYSILWGEELANGQLPSYQVPLAPTPHPLSTLFGVLLSPLGASAETVWVVVAFVCLGALGWVTYELGKEWFGAAAGILAALIIITREPVLSYGARAYIDIAYVVIVLGALLWETRRRRAGIPVLLLLAVAGLLRPEAWLFSAAYVVYLFFTGERRTLTLISYCAIAASAPVIWMLSDLLLAGSALYSLTDTQHNVATLNRKTGLLNVFLVAPRRIGEVLREPVLLGALLGFIAALICLRRRIRLPLWAGILALVAFSILAAANMPILGRYLLAPATLIAIFCGAAVFGWTKLKRENPWRRRWQVMSVIPVLALVVFLPGQVSRINNLHATLKTQKQIRDDLQALATTTATRVALLKEQAQEKAPITNRSSERTSKNSSAVPISVQNHRPVPLLALWLNRSPTDIHSAQLLSQTNGIYFSPATPEVEKNFILDKNDPKKLTAEVPSDFQEVTRNRSWILFARNRSNSDT